MLFLQKNELMGDNEREIKVWRYASPCGRLLIGDYEGKVCLCDWDLPLRAVQVVERVSRILDAECVEGKSPLIERVIAQLEEYFEGKRSEFDLAAFKKRLHIVEGFLKLISILGLIALIIATNPLWRGDIISTTCQSHRAATSSESRGIGM